MVDRPSRLRIGDNYASEKAGEDWYKVWSIVRTVMPEASFVKYDGFEVHLHLSAFMPDLEGDHGVTRYS